MAQLPATVKGYAVLVLVAGLALCLVGWSIRPSQPLVYGAMPLVMAALSAMALMFPLRLSRSQKMTVAIAVDFASLLLFGPLVAMVVAGVSRVAANLALRAMGKRDLWNVLFNTGQSMVGVGLAGLAFSGIAPGSAPRLFENTGVLIAVITAAATLYLWNSLAVAVAVGLQYGENPLEVWLAGRRLEVLQSVALFLVGLVAALTVERHPWAIVVLVLPTAIIYLSLKRTVQLIEQTILAVEAMADVVDMRDHYTFEHSRRVADYAVRIARHMGLSSDEVETIRLAARVHDLGKIGVPDGVLLKPGKLTSEEWQIMRKHPEIGYQILSRFPEYGKGKELVLCHHERFDGKGYPRGLDGRELSLSAQIVSVADALDAMTSDRPYRPAMSLEQAMAEFRRCSGTQWDPRVVAALEELMARDGVAAPARAPVAVSA